MKMFILMLSLFSSLLFAGVTPGPNLEVKMGELTGAGSRYSLKSLRGFVHPNGYIMKEDCAKIIVKNSIDPKISDVESIQVGNELIDANDLTGFILQK